MPARRPTAQLMPPSPALASCVRAYLARSTVGCTLADHERINRFPASPSCTVSWFVQGSACWAHGGQPLPGRIVFRGPQTQPTITSNPGPVQVFTMVLRPDALHAMTGIVAARHVDRFSAADAVFGADWQALLQAVLAAPDDAARVQLIEAFMLPRWQALPGMAGMAGMPGMPGACGHRDWTQTLAWRAQTTGLGRSVRQAERRVRAWVGLPLSRLRGLSRSEGLLLDARSAHGLGSLNWADAAAAAGYADQSHSCRESRRFTGLSPQRLLQRLADDESLWLYRLWR